MNDLFRYQGCGLDNVFLRNGYRETVSAAGDKRIFIEDIEGLHKAIAMFIVDDASPLDAKTFRFLRKELDMSQRQMGEVLGVSEQTVSLWERARQPIPQSADIFVRALTKETCSGNAELRRMIERMNSLDREERSKIELEKNDGHWEMSQCA
jgi:DNA-binding transcriptional regulator YiaG